MSRAVPVGFFQLHWPLGGLRFGVEGLERAELQWWPKGDYEARIAALEQRDARDLAQTISENKGRLNALMRSRRRDNK